MHSRIEIETVNGLVAEAVEVVEVVEVVEAVEAVEAEAVEGSPLAGGDAGATV
jgi:hypothetical protein